MRYVIPCVGLGGLLFVAGCTNSRLGFLNRQDNPAPVNTTTPTPTAAALVAYLNNNAQLVRSLRCDNMELTASKGLGIVAKVDLSGSLACEQPRNFRMVARAAGNDQLDVGSNNQEFWFWIKQMDPRQFYCPYQAMNGQKVQLPFPFQPEWVMETLGMGNYGSGADWQLTVDPAKDPKWYKLIQHTRGPQGNAVRKVIIFNARTQTGSSPQVTDYQLIDEATNKEECSARILEVQGDAARGVVRRRIQLHWPKVGATLTLRLGQASLNPTLPGPLFVRRPLSGQPSYNLATGRTDGQTS